MATKRSHSTYASDSLPPSYATYGTPLPPETSARDDGSYLPLWKQEVRDERGRKRLHGAFTGGWSAGYFNTVGSKEGWTPSTFVSSRSDRRKDDKEKEKGNGMRPEDFMDDEDLADQAESQKLQTSGAFAGLGDGGREESKGGLMGLLRADGDTMGTKLLRRMGWKDGQGIGPKVRRGARLGLKANGKGEDQMHLFAPENAPMIRFNRKTDRKGLGHDGESKLSSISTPRNGEEDEDEAPSERSSFSLAPSQKKKPQKRSGIGVGILNDDGSDEEDPYEVGPKISYNRILGEKKKKKKAKPKESVSANPTLGNAPVFLSKSARGLRRCHDGRLPLDGFVLAKITEDFSNLLSEYAPPPVPEGWVSSKQKEASASDKPHISASEAAKAPNLDPKSRAALLGEATLPGKSVFDFLSSATRDKLAAASGRSNLPQGRGEIPEEYRLTPDEKHAKLWEESPKVDAGTAVAALGRTNGGPYSDNEAKRERYRYYLSACAYPDAYPAPQKKKGETDDDFTREMAEFHACAGIFKPLTGAAASRFTSATEIIGGDNQAGGLSGAKPAKPPKPSDPAMEAAKMGMFGKMTRAEDIWYPARLLCKRFNVKVPEHVQVPGDAAKDGTDTPPSGDYASMSAPGAGLRPGSGVTMDPEADSRSSSGVKEILAPSSALGHEKVDSERNEAVEAGPAHAEVLKAIFGDSDSD